MTYAIINTTLKRTNERRSLLRLAFFDVSFAYWSLILSFWLKVMKNYMKVENLDKMQDKMQKNTPKKKSNQINVDFFKNHLHEKIGSL